MHNNTSIVIGDVDMQKQFITIGGTRIRISNIKNYGISGKEESYIYSMIDYDFRRKIWFVHDGSLSTGAKIGIGIGIGAAAIGLLTYAVLSTKDNSDYDDYNDLYSPHSSSNDDKIRHVTVYPHDEAWDNYIDMNKLKDEYNVLKKQKGNQRKMFKKNGVLSKQEAIVKGTTGRNLQEKTWKELSSNIAYTRGRLCFDGKILRCEGSPYIIDGVYISRIHGTTAALIETGELREIKREEITDTVSEYNRYLYVATFQKDNFTFSINEYDVYAILNELDNCCQ